MTDEELVKYCMCGCMYLEAECPNCNKVSDADRIEALTAENARLERVVEDLSDEVDLAEQEASMVEDDFVKAEKEIKALTAKLEKAVEGLLLARVHVANNEQGWSVGRASARSDLKIINALLAEIEGGKG